MEVIVRWYNVAASVGTKISYSPYPLYMTNYFTLNSIGSQNQTFREVLGLASVTLYAYNVYNVKQMASTAYPKA